VKHARSGKAWTCSVDGNIDDGGIVESAAEDHRGCRPPCLLDLPAPGAILPRFEGF
jgi:hypothetical protein